ncbi:hypothetical protein [Clostridium sp. AN503]|uniref:hypothetical protein n=1 Tax=Clostridium sp. AN503 TaxID=3160598 RepID=UPI003459B896
MTVLSKEEKMLQELFGYSEEQLLAEMDLAEDACRKCQEPVTKEQTEKGFQDLMHRIKSRKQNPK